MLMMQDEAHGLKIFRAGVKVLRNRRCFPFGFIKKFIKDFAHHFVWRGEIAVKQKDAVRASGAAGACFVESIFGVFQGCQKLARFPYAPALR